MIFDIQRYSVHDGPGIRTLIFMKGCPLRCHWCSNPESQNAMPEVAHIEKNCIRCGACVQVCSALAIHPENYSIDKTKCTECGSCASVCPVNGMKIFGRCVTVNELLREVEQDRLFYANSGGGVTVGGGEPLMQADFVAELLAELQGIGIHTAIETCGHGNAASFDKVIAHTDIMLYDLKQMDDEKHSGATGVGNALILQNARRAADSVDTIFRVPLIPGFNDDDENLEKTFAFAAGCARCRGVHLLPYHNFGVHKYEQLSRDYPLRDLAPIGTSGKDALRARISGMDHKIEITVV